MSKHDTLVTRITSVERLGTSYYGNPYYRVHTESGSYRTSIDSGMNYGIENRDARENTVRLHLTKAGRVYALDILPVCAVLDMAITEARARSMAAHPAGKANPHAALREAGMVWDD